jgi:hypothetical protein
MVFNYSLLIGSTLNNILIENRVELIKFIADGEKRNLCLPMVKN